MDVGDLSKIPLQSDSLEVWWNVSWSESYPWIILIIFENSEIFLHLKCFRMNQIGQPITDLFIGGKPLKLMSWLESQKKVTLVKIKEIYLWTLTNIALLSKHHQSDVRLSIFNATFHQWKSPFARNLIRKVLESCFCLLANKTLGYIRSSAVQLYCRGTK